MIFNLFLLIASVVAVVTFNAIRLKRSRATFWSETAELLGQCDAKWPTDIEGHFNRIPTRLITKQFGRENLLNLSMTIDNSEGLRIHIAPAERLKSSIRTLGMPEVVISPTLAEVICIKSRNEDFVRSAITPEMETLLIHIWDIMGAQGYLKLSDNVLMYECCVPSDFQILRKYVPQLLDVMHAIATRTKSIS
jgi:hypothetical protein